jgi:hypothetical protein
VVTTLKSRECEGSGGRANAAPPVWRPAADAIDEMMVH